MFFQHLIDAARVLQGIIADRNALLVFFDSPGILAITALFLVEAREQAVIKRVVGTDDLRGVGVILDVLFLDKVVVDDMLDHSAEEGDVGTGTKRHMIVAPGGGAGVARVDMDDLGAPVFRPHNPFKGDRVVFGGIAAHDEDTVTVL
ncbi:MAG: hypothetical protein ACD_75C01117G0001 [uncultured bacterium]|nr:MAG: hypothetical protein ACD_75C01117G0001 [uncultured bacterium]